LAPGRRPLRRFFELGSVEETPLPLSVVIRSTPAVHLLCGGSVSRTDVEI
jgi:hypothetical protein